MFNRRRFLQSTAAASAGLIVGCQSAPLKRRVISPNEKLNVGVIGVAGRGAENIEGIKGENIVALCDVNSNNVAAAATKFPAARAYTDWRRMLEQPDLDAVL